MFSNGLGKKPGPSNCIPFTIFTSHGNSSSPWHDICCSGVTGSNGFCGSHKKALGGANRFKCFNVSGGSCDVRSMVEEWWIIRGKQLFFCRISYRSLEAYRCGSFCSINICVVHIGSPAFRNGSSHFKEEFDSFWLTSSPTYQHSGCLGSVQQSCLAWGLFIIFHDSKCFEPIIEMGWDMFFVPWLLSEFCCLPNSATRQSLSLNGVVEWNLCSTRLLCDINRLPRSSLWQTDARTAQSKRIKWPWLWRACDWAIR